MMLDSHRTAISRTVSIVIAVIIIVAAAAGGFYVISTLNTSTNTTTSTGSLTDVTFGFAGVADVTDTPGLMFWQTFAPQVGLNLHTQYFDGDASVAQALVAGSIQVAEGGFQSTLLADQAQGNSSGSYPFLTFANYESVNDYALVVSNSIKNWSDLAGKPIATSGPGSSSELFCKILEQQHGLTASQINCAATGGGGTRLRALLAGQVVGDIAEPFAVVTALASGDYHIIATIPQGLPDLLFSVLYTSRSYAAAHPDVITKISEAIMLSARWAQNQSAWVAKEQTAFPGTNLTIAATSWKIWIAMNLWNPNGGLTADKVTYSERFLINASVVNSYLDPKYWVDTSYETNALNSIGQYNGPAGGYPDNSLPTMNVTIPGFGAILSKLGGSFSGQNSPFLFLAQVNEISRRGSV
jgi:sulfonate transport system substrate-binding protein